MPRILIDNEPVAIEKAYEELTRTAFAVWIRLLVTPGKALTGRKRIAEMLGYSLPRCSHVLKELYAMGYINIHRMKRRGGPSVITIVKRGKISGPSKFLTLSNVIIQSETGENKDTDSIDGAAPGVYNNAVPKNLNISLQKENDLESYASPYNACVSNNTELPFVGQQTHHIVGLSGHRTTDGILGRIVPKCRNKVTFPIPAEGIDELDDIISEISLKHKLSCHQESSIKSNKSLIDLNKINEIRRKAKEERSKIARKRKGKNRRFLVTTIDWTKLDETTQGRQEGAVVSFKPSPKNRERMIEILGRHERDKEKMALVSSITAEFVRIYTRYRKSLQKEAGNKPSYMMIDKEEKYARKAAEYCIRKSVTPKQVIAYWHRHIGNFADGTMTIPPLVFLSSPANIDTVACASLEDDDAGWKSGMPKPNTPPSHGFSDTRQLDNRLRKALEGAGFSTTAWPDRYLLTIQKTAEAIAKGHRMFVGADMKPMVDWAAENLYEK